MRELWDIKAFRLLFLAGFFSELGTFISEVAIMMRIFELAGQQKQYLGITQGLFLLAMILGTLLGGVFGEGRAKRRLLVICELARIPVLLAMLFGGASLWTLILGNALVALFSGAFNPTRQALMNEILPPALVPRANGIFSVGFAFLHAAGPLLGGVLYGFFHALSPLLCFDLATYFFGIALLLRIRMPAQAATAPEVSTRDSDFFGDLRAGLSLVGTRPEFRNLLLRAFLMSLALGILIPLLLPFSSEVLHLPDYGYGILLGVFGLGGVVGGVLVPRKFLRVFFLGECLSLVGWAFVTNATGSFALAFAYGLFLFGRIAGQLTFVSERLPKAMNSRANSLVDLAMVVPNVLGAGVVALLGATVDTRGILERTAVLVGVGALALFVLDRAIEK